MERNASKSTSLPFPILGENSRDPLLEMDPRYAVSMINIFPEGSYGEVRKGYRPHSSGMGSGNVSTLVEHVKVDGTRTLLAAANGNIYNATTYAGTASSLGSGFSSNYWQTVAYLQNTIFVNGVDQPQKYNGSTLAASAYTGITDDAVLVDVCVFKERLYFVEKDSTSFWYGAAGTVSGALTEFEVGDFLRKGGYLQAIASWTANTGAGMQDLLVLISSQGEVLTYSGTDPASDFSLDGRYFLPIPHGRRCKQNIGADLFILHQDGVTNLGSLINGIDVSQGYTQFNNAIAPTHASFSNLYKDNVGWELFFYESGHSAIINIPVTTSTYNQFAMNTNSGGWCQYRGLNAATWCMFNNKPYFGGTDGKVYEAFKTNADNGADINASVKYAFNFFNDRTRTKAFHMASAQIIGTGSANLFFSIDVDGSNQTNYDSIEVTTGTGSEWETSEWETTPWGEEQVYSTNWEGLSGYGRSAALKISGKFRNVGIKISSAQIQYEVGGYL